MLAEECYIVKALDRELPFEEMETHLLSLPEVRRVVTRPPGAFMMSDSAETAEIVDTMILRDDTKLPACAIYLFFRRPDQLVLDVEGGNTGDRRVLVSFLEWLNERCPIALHDNEGDYVHEIDEKGFSAFLEGWQ